MRSLGADAVIDYRRHDFTAGRDRYDLILDLVAHGSVLAYRRALAPGGRYLCAGGSVPTLLRVVTVGSAAGLLSGRRLGLLGVKEGPDHFTPLARMCASGEVPVRIDRVSPLDRAADALRYVGEGRALDKVVVTLGEA